MDSASRRWNNAKKNQGLYEYQEEDNVLIDETLLLLETDNPLQVLCQSVFPNFLASYQNLEKLVGTSILTPRNKTVDEINSFLLSKVPGISKEYLSANSISHGEADDERI